MSNLGGNMKHRLLVIGLGSGLMAITFLFLASERWLAARETQTAIKTINQGVDWDRRTPISPETQSVRLAANQALLRNQRTQRNTHGAAAFLLALLGLTAMITLRNQTRV